MLDHPVNDVSRPAQGLSPRELEVLAMTSQGKTNLEIAQLLKVTVHAVKFHLASIYRKLGVTNRTEASFIFLRDSANDNGRADPAPGAN